MVKADAQDTERMRMSSRPVRSATSAVESLGGEVDIAFERDRCLQLEQLGAGERTE